MITVGGGERNLKKAFEYYMKAALKDHATACNNLAVCYHDGLGVGKDKAKAWTWYLQAAELGSSHAQIEVASCYASGKGVAKDEALAVKWWTKAAEKDEPRAQKELGDYCWRKKNNEKAFEWWLAAAYNGDETAMGNIGYMYYHGIGAEKDVDEAKHWLTKAAEAGNEKSEEHLKEYWG